MSKFKKATKKKCKARIAIYGVSGGGKTFSALRIATGLGKRIAVIDTEHGSASKYSDRFEFDVLDLTDYSTEAYGAAIRDANGYDVLIIDSLSHGWQELIEEVDKLANAKYRGNTWSAWSEGTPKQRALVEAILSFPGHVIATIRSKTEWSEEKTSNGKSRPVRVGLSPQQGKGIEYEFDMLVSISQEHVAFVEKDRSGKFQDRVIDKPGEDLGKEIAAWLDQGEPAGGDAGNSQPPPPSSDTPPADAMQRYNKAAGLIAAEDDPAKLLNLLAGVKQRKADGTFTPDMADTLLLECYRKAYRVAGDDSETKAVIREDFVKACNAGMLSDRVMDEIEHAFAELQAA